MIKILLFGANGRMGNAVTAAANESDGVFAVTSGVDVSDADSPFPVYHDIELVSDIPDVIIDFSHHTSLPSIMRYAVKHSVPVVIATTGHTDEEMQTMKDSAESIPIFFSRNMSLGVNLLIALAKKASSILGEDFDIEIIEKHHHNKLDAPSGTALMIADAISQTRNDTEYVYDRHSVRKKRESKEIGIHAVRGGSIIGEHEVIFAGKDEVITISHSAASRELFATGALKAAEFIIKQESGLYSMDDMLSNI